MNKIQGSVFTAGVFDLFHAGHMESIMKIIAQFPNRNIIIGVASDAYTKSFKRQPIQYFSDRKNTIESVFASLKNITVIEDPLKVYTDNYEQWFYDEYNITDHCQGTDFDENPQVYAYIKSIDGFHIMGRSELMSTTTLINTLSPSEVIKLGGDTNKNYRIGNIVIKKITYGSTKFIDDSYTQLVEKQKFGITHFTRYEDLAFLPYIEGNVTPEINIAELSSLIDQINNSGLKPSMSILDVFGFYNYVPDKDEYGTLLKDISHVSHGDMAYFNIVKGQTGIFPIDWETLCFSVKNWDSAPFFASLYIHKHDTFESLCKKITGFATLRNVSFEDVSILIRLLCDYWIQWSLHTGHDYFSKELKELKHLLLAKHNDEK